MVFYLDLILLLNLVIDYFILLATSKFLHLSYKKWRLALASLLGALYTLVFFFPNLTFFHLFTTKIILSIFMVLMSFGFSDLFQFIQTIITFYFVSFVTGGGVFALQYLFNIKHDVINGIYVSRSSSPLMVLVLILLAFFGIWIFSNRTYQTIWRKTEVIHKILDVEVFINEFSYKCKGLIDTGNRLYDPITRKPVMILEATDVSFIPSVFRNIYRNGQFQIELFNQIADQIDPTWLSRISLVPFRSVTREMQFILTIRPDKVVITSDSNKQLITTKVLVGLDYNQLSNDKVFQAIIHPDLLVG
ncbi:sigma-E processing peptidase SpoIIGA [Vulcanibacillus modesticaldus]|uniref:Sporulation sigma-E factor-processing peptidase n=1 Tax=Vulcanibacillus modesticaldus TaxID=337097 RepID=A0A1D2YUZ4_9BACI|nr:sigma-E processing peptidase SpoIIGA [Vulcanibacillus modesticaldus]OEF99532.1 sigma-E processing peptidase SpoIIGA [Vulcanibacillus modesticaldus]